MSNQFEVILSDPHSSLPMRATDGSAGYDLFACEDRSLHAWTWGNIRLGIKVGLPMNHYGQMAGRSGLMAKHGIWCFPGVIDCDYRGELTAILYNGSPARYSITTGDRVAQLLILPVFMQTRSALIVQELPETERGEGGYGSTGI